jgi:hypothetical protein
MRAAVWKYRRWITAGVAVLAAFFVFMGVFADRLVEPVLKQRLHALIIKGSDSLYTYTLGDLNTNVLGGCAEIINLDVKVDSTRFRQLKAAHALPSVTVEVQIAKGEIRGLGVLPLLFSKRLALHEFISTDADVRFIRHIGQGNAPDDAPLWKSIRPALTRITVDHVNLDGIKLLYRYADTSESMKIQFDTCYAYFKDIRIDSAAMADTNRILLAREVTMRFRDLKYRSQDSVNKLKAEEILYSSSRRVLEVKNFKIQPTRKNPEEFYAWIGRQKVMNTVVFDRAVVSGLHLDRFLHNETIQADSVSVEGLQSSLFLDKTRPIDLKSKIGQYPHQLLLRAPSRVFIPRVVVRDAALVYTERGEQTGEKGALSLKGISGVITNVTNDPVQIRKNNRMVANLKGRILNTSPIAINLTLFLDSSNGRFHADGWVKNVSAPQLNGLAGSLASTRLQSFDMRQLDFSMSGDDFTARGAVHMKYNNLHVVLQKVDEETGVVKQKKFFTKLLNSFVLHESNPGTNGVERTAQGVVYNRLTSQSFFGLIWKTIFKGMQDVMMRRDELKVVPVT